MTDRRLKDVLTFASSQEVLEAVKEAGARLSSLAVHGRSTQARTEQSLSLHNLARHTGQELLRIARNFDQGLDIIAWSTRNIFELNLLVRYVLQAEANATRFLAESAMDEQQVLEGFLSLAATPTSDAIRAVKDRIASLSAMAAKHGISLLKPLPTAELAKLVGCTEEYTGMFKFMSKYVHPSSWLVNRSSEDTQGDSYRDILLVNAQLYAGDSYERIRVAFGLASDA